MANSVDGPASAAAKVAESRDVVAPAPRSYSGGTKGSDKPPSVDEWQDFFGRIVIKVLTDGYVTLVMRDFIDELDARERALCEMTKEECHELAAPFASLATRSKFMKKHGRTIVASADSWEAVIVLVMWMRRVNRIARKHRQAREENQIPKGPLTSQGRFASESVREVQAEGSQPSPNGNGRVGHPGAIGIVNPGSG